MVKFGTNCETIAYIFFLNTHIMLFFCFFISSLLFFYRKGEGREGPRFAASCLGRGTRNAFAGRPETSRQRWPTPLVGRSAIFADLQSTTRSGIRFSQIMCPLVEGNKSHDRRSIAMRSSVNYSCAAVAYLVGNFIVFCP